MDLHHPPAAVSRPTSYSVVGIASLPPLDGERAFWATSSLLVILCVLILLNVPESFLGAGVLQRPPEATVTGADGRPGSCDYSYGMWVWDENPQPGAYSEDCRFLDPGFRCRRNGRKDDGYSKWRWQPHDCDLPRFNASDMLEKSRNTRIVFAGDSIGRNHWESLVCMLASAVPDQSGIYEKNGRPITKHKGYLAIRFHDYNLTIEYHRTPFLVPVDRPAPDSPPQVKRAVRVDRMHWQSRQWVGADVLVFNAGHWWNQDKTFKMGCYFQEGEQVNTTMDVREAYRRMLQTWRRWVIQNLHPNKSYVFFRSFSPVHYQGGAWNTGGRCDSSSEPEAKSHSPSEPWSNRAIWEVVGQLKEEVPGLKAQFLNVTYLTELRGDGHPSLHREPGTPAHSPQDCSHWCLPGVPDTWNALLYAYLYI